MLPNAFIGKASQPTDDELTAELGESRRLWDDVLARLASECKIVDQEWNSYSKKAGWSLRLKVKKRNILYLGPRHGSFRVAFVLGDRAVAAARAGKLPRSILKMVEEGQHYPEGTAVRFDVSGLKDVDAVVKLAAIKLQN
jgi:hypothetical protein